MGSRFQAASTMSEPTVSVYLPTRNRADLLQEAIESVLTQDFERFELIIVDDASTDDTPRLVAEYSARDVRVRSIRLPSKSGACAARNVGIEAARSPWCTGLDDDDLMLPHRLSLLLNAAGQSSAHALICSGYLLERDDKRRPVDCHAAVITLNELLHRNIIGNQALFRREHALEIGGFDIDMPASQDYDFWTRLLARFGTAKRLPEATYVFREHDHATTRITKTEAAIAGARRYTEKYRHLMSRAHLQSQRLIHRYVAGEPLTLGLAATSINAHNIGFVLRYAAQRWPLLSKVRDKLR
jgi:glycosyltransferase involved in cell wall biosynthesis